MASLKSQLVLFVVLCLFGVCCLQELHIKDGAILGTTTQISNGRTIYCYRGIPYAGQPVRFKDSVPVKPWKGVRNATEDGPVCIQRRYTNPAAPFGVIGSEDCLSINVYTPYDPRSCQSKEKLPVLVYIYSGSWVQGSASAQIDPQFLLTKNIVLAAFNYRVDAFGFLTTTDKTAPGNYGLKDQVLALKWVNQNIEFFGGDPNQVTIFGASVGGTSVHFHCFSPLSRGLFHRMISDSGNAFSPLAINPADRVKTDSMIIAEALDCPTKSSSAMIECLREIPAEKIIKIQARLFGVEGGYHAPFVIKRMLPIFDAPFSDEPFFDCNPRSANCSQCSLPWINGFAKFDGSSYVCTIYNFPHYEKLVEKYASPYLADHIYLNNVFPVDDYPIIIDKVLQFYFKGEPISRNKTRTLATALNDFIYYTTSLRATLGHPGTVYSYRYDYVASQSYSEIYGCACTVKPKPTHLDDLLTLSELNASFNRTYTKSDLQVIKYHVDLWTSFVITGVPSSGCGCESVDWEPAGTERNFKYLALGKSPVLESGLPYPTRWYFWKSLIDKYGYKF